MSLEGMDPSLMQDFLTESSELIEQLDSDLVALESADGDDASELLGGIFRALHTIKGAASFLALTEVITFAHAAEDALNKLRKGEAEVTTEVMDALLRSSDVLRQQIDDLNAGSTANEAPADLLDLLHGIAEGNAGTPSGSAEASTTGPADQDAATPNTSSGSRSLELPAQKLDLVEFMADDLVDSCNEIVTALAKARQDESRADAAEDLHRLGDCLEKTTDFFELTALTQLVGYITKAADILPNLSGAMLDDLLVRLEAVKILVEEQAGVIERQEERIWPLETLVSRLQMLIEGNVLAADIAGAHGNDVNRVLRLDGVINDDAPAVADSQPVVPDAPVDPIPAPPAEIEPAAPAAQTAPASPSTETPAARAAEPKRVMAEQTIRVEVNRLEALLNMVGQLVLNKNRFLALTRRVGERAIPQDLREDMATAASDYDRITSELQMGVMRTRMQPLAKLFDRYPRVIRDIARSTDKKIDLEIVGRETEVDKSVLELLADPLVHILRNSADHGVETPEQRRNTDKSETGCIQLQAEHQGSHVRLAITDDGKGLDREVIGNLAVERGLCAKEQLASISDEDVFRFIFAAGFSTAKKVSNLSGRGVGMDVVRTNVTKMNGTINITSVKGKGTTIEILIPLTVAIMPAMMVGVGSHLYAVPLQSISEIVRPDEQSMHTIHGQPVLRLRDTVLPLIDMQGRLNETRPEDGGKFAVVVGVGGQRAGLIVDRLIGQQEIVIKPLDDHYAKGGPFSGATIREDGDVSLILDVVQLMRQTRNVEKAAA